MRFLAVFLALVLALNSISASAQQYSEADPFPLLAVSKTVSQPDISLGSSFDVVVTVTNSGQSPAYDVHVKDLLVNGTEKNKVLPSLGPQESTTLRYTVYPTALGRYQVGVTHVTYNLELGNSNTQLRALSNLVLEEKAYYLGDGVDDQSFRGSVLVLTPENFARAHRGRHLQIVSYLFLGAIPALFPFIFFRMKRAEEDVLLRRSKYMK